MKPGKAASRNAWRIARERQEREYREWLMVAANDLVKLSRKARAELKREKWAELSPPPLPKPGAPRSAGREARKEAWFVMKSEVEAEMMARLRK